jgi:DNA-binding beta-propeller fold protein YncE
MLRSIALSATLMLLGSTLQAQFGDGRGEFIFPLGIALDRFGNIYVTETGNDRVQKLDQSQEWLGGWGRFGSDSSRFNDPMGIALADQDLVLVADAGNRRVMIFTVEGRNLSNFSLPDSSLPWGLAVSGELVYVSDEARGLVEVRGLNGELKRTIGRPGREPGQLDKPRGLALDDQGRLWVVDSGNNRVQVFSPDGEPVLSFGSYGDNEGEFDGPSGIAISRQGLVYVTDSGNDRFQEFDLTGAFRSQGGASGPEPGQFLNPQGIAVDDQGSLFIVDSDNHRLQFFGAQ